MFIYLLRHSRLLFILCTTLFAGCMVGPNFHRPPPPMPERYTASPMPSKTVQAKVHGGNAQHFALGEDIPAQWWCLFHSHELNELIAQGIAYNSTLESAQAALEQAQENLRAEIGNALFPVVDGQFAATRQKFLGNTFGINGPAGGSSVFSLYTASVTVSYVLDIWGGARRQVEAVAAQTDYQQFLEEAAYLTLTSNIVTSAVNLASLRAQIQATHELIDIERQQLQITKQQFRLGGVSQLNVLAQQTQLEQTIALLPTLEKNLNQTYDALSVLVGDLPSESCLPAFNLNNLHLPTVLPVSIPSSLVAQRPDILASEALLHQASAQIGVATANLLPKFTLNATYGFQSNSLGDLFNSKNNFWSYGLNVLQPIFHGGALRAQRRAALAGFDKALADYRQTVLEAFQNVADVLRALEIDAHNLQIQVAAENSARGTLRLSQQQYRLGGVSYLSLLNANFQYQQARIARIQAQALRYQDTAALFQALGGGWWNRGMEP